jgi:hypothetical protein
MALCTVCKDFDIRALLLQAVAQKTRPSGITDRNLIDAEDYRPPIPYFYKHYSSIVALRRSSEEGCDLCDLFWRTWTKTLTKSDITDEWLEATFEGIIYIGCSGWTTSREGLPYVAVTQKPSFGGSRTLCSFEAFADRGTIICSSHTSLSRANVS